MLFVAFVSVSSWLILVFVVIAVVVVDRDRRDRRWPGDGKVDGRSRRLISR
jgi:hypothetical protein